MYYSLLDGLLLCRRIRYTHKEQGFQLLERLLGYAQLESEVYTISQHEAFLQGLNLVYETKVYDKALAYAHKE